MTSKQTSLAILNQQPPVTDEMPGGLLVRADVYRILQLPGSGALPIPFGCGQGYPQRRVMVAPSISTEGSAEQSVLFSMIAFVWTKLVAERIAPSKDSSVDTRASVLISANLGNAKADSIPRMTITITSSIKVKP